MGDFDIDIDTNDLEDKLKDIKDIPSLVNLALRRAINKTETGMKTDAAREITKEYIIKNKEVKDKLATEKVLGSQMSISLTSKGRPIRLIKFRYRKNTKPRNKKGKAIWAKVKKSSAGGYITESVGGKVSKGFITTFKPGQKDDVERKEGIFTRYNKEGQIQQHFGPGVVQMLQSIHSKDSLTKKAADRFNKNLEHEVEYVLKEEK